MVKRRHSGRIVRIFWLSRVMRCRLDKRLGVANDNAGVTVTSVGLAGILHILYSPMCRWSNIGMYVVLTLYVTTIVREQNKKLHQLNVFCKLKTAQRRTVRQRGDVERRAVLVAAVEELAARETTHHPDDQYPLYSCVAVPYAAPIAHRYTLQLTHQWMR